MSYKDELFDLELRKQILKIEFYRTKDEDRKSEIKELLDEIESARKKVKNKLVKSYKKAGIHFE